MTRVILFVVFICTIGCNNREAGTAVSTQENIRDTANETFFPVTNYIRGQIHDIASKGINPIKYIIQNNTTDSSWVKIEDMEKEVSPFLNPIIDNYNMKALYTENKFLDQTINAYTFTYDPIGPMADSISLQHWDVYVDPDKEIVTRIYMLKKTNDNKTQQLTWQSDKWCKIVTIADNKGQSAVEKEILIKWDY